MSEFSYNKRGVRLTQYDSDHSSIDLHTQKSGKTEIVASHHPQPAEGDKLNYEEFYTVEFTHRQETSKESGDFTLRGSTSDSVTIYVDRAEMEALHFALGEVLAQSVGVARGAASVRVRGSEIDVPWTQKAENGFDGLPVDMTVEDAGKALDVEA